ncbi:hypothetical protein [Bacillus cereus]|uniref:hypothetical protein n=1 Tax=Bacillus cereus TaxID=1396 RepID=UPI0009BE12D6|nr:hypothetical protein [Bacillus cereus]
MLPNKKKIYFTGIIKLTIMRSSFIVPLSTIFSYTQENTDSAQTIQGQTFTDENEQLISLGAFAKSNPYCMIGDSSNEMYNFYNYIKQRLLDKKIENKIC